MEPCPHSAFAAQPHVGRTWPSPPRFLGPTPTARGGGPLRLPWGLDPQAVVRRALRDRRGAGPHKPLGPVSRWQKRLVRSPWGWAPEADAGRVTCDAAIAWGPTTIGIWGLALRRSHGAVPPPSARAQPRVDRNAPCPYRLFGPSPTVVEGFWRRAPQRSRGGLAPWFLSPSLTPVAPRFAPFPV